MSSDEEICEKLAKYTETLDVVGYGFLEEVGERIAILVKEAKQDKADIAELTADMAYDKHTDLCRLLRDLKAVIALAVGAGVSEEEILSKIETKDWGGGLPTQEPKKNKPASMF